MRKENKRRDAGREYASAYVQQRYGYEQDNSESAVDQFAQRLDIRAEALDSMPLANSSSEI